MTEKSFGLDPYEWNGIHYWDNKKNLPSILMLHNGGDTHAVWGHQIQRWSDQYRIIVPDIPGFGNSRRTNNIGTIDALVEELSSWIRALEVQPHSLMGVCIGASLALELARRQVVTPTRLILVNLCIGYSGLSLGLREFGKILRRLGPRPLRFLASLPGLNDQVAMSTWLKPRFGDPVYQRLLKNTCDPNQFLSRHKLVTGLESFDQWWAALDTIPPHHLIWGQRNRVLSPNVGRLVRERLETKSFHWLEESSHLPMAEQPETFCQLVESLS
jgi:pimeloyl-ACP methyl ester carboxylesterase